MDKSETHSLDPGILFCDVLHPGTVLAREQKAALDTGKELRDMILRAAGRRVL